MAEFVGEVFRPAELRDDMKTVRVRRIDGVFLDLQPVAAEIESFARHVVDVGQRKPVERREYRDPVGRAEIGEQDAAEFVGRIGALARIPSHWPSGFC